VPLTSPPEVRIGADLTWYPMEWDDTPPPSGRGPKMTARDVQFFRWTVTVDAEAPRVARLYVSGPDGPEAEGAVVVPVGTHPTLVRLTLQGELVELAGRYIVITA